MTEEEKTQAYQAAADWVSNTFPNGEERYPHWPMIEAALEAAEKVREQESVNNAARYKEALEAIPMVLNMGASQQDVLNIVNNALKED